MNSPPADDLTDTWHGRFAFPRLHEPVSFTARLEQSGGLLSGRVEELGNIGAAAGKRLTATLTGAVSGAWSPSSRPTTHSSKATTSVHYSGAVCDEGLEISGTWTIPGNWSGTLFGGRLR